MSLRDQLHAIYASHGELTPQTVVDTARAKRHPLHDRFEWNNAVAGEKYRLVQAAELIRSVKVIHTGQPATDVREFVHVERADGHTYVPVEEIAGDEITSEIVLRQAEREWKALKRRYEHLRGFLSLVRGDVQQEAS